MKKEFKIGDHVDWPPRGYVGRIVALVDGAAYLSSAWQSAPTIELIPSLTPPRVLREFMALQTEGRMDGPEVLETPTLLAQTEGEDHGCDH